MTRKALHSNDAPQAIGPYSQAVQVTAGRMVFFSGQIAMDPATGKLLDGDIQAQTERVMQNLRALLLAAGMDFSHVVRCSVFLTNLADFAQVNEVYGRYFTAEPPARTTVQVPALPKGAQVEIDAIAVG